VELSYSPTFPTTNVPFTVNWSSTGDSAVLYWTLDGGTEQSMQLPGPSGSTQLTLSTEGHYTTRLVVTGPGGTNQKVLGLTVVDAIEESVQLILPITVGPGTNLIAGQTYTFGMRYLCTPDDGVQAAINITVAGVAWTSNMPRYNNQTAYYDFVAPAIPGVYQASCAIDGRTGTLFAAANVNVN
jgi:hypothetical protein